VAVQLPNGRNYFATATGAPGVGYRLYTYIPGTSTPKATYTTSSASVANTNPVVADARGEMVIYWDGSYDVVLKDSNDVVIWGPERLEDAAGNLGDRLADTISASNGDALVGVKSTATGAVGTTQHEVNERRRSVADWMSPAQIADAASRTNALDCTTAVQAAVTWCVANHAALEVPYRVRITTVNIDRAESPTYDEYFRIEGVSGGGFYTTSASPMFSSTLAFTTAPVTSLVKFVGIYFESSSNALGNFVLDNAKFLRTAFESCDFSKIRCLYAPTVYTQSIYFTNCNMRRWTGVFFDSDGGNYDLKVHNCLMEAGVEGFDLATPSGTSFTNNCIEGLTTGAAIRASNSQSLHIAGNYFEANNIDVVLNVGIQQGVSLVGNKMVASTGTYNVFWGQAINCVSVGNYSVLGTGLHNLQGNSQVSINDYSSTLVSNIAQYLRIPYNAPSIRVSATSSQGPFSSSTFTKVTFTQEDWDTNGNFSSSTFTPTVEGYYHYDTTVRINGTNISQIIVLAYKNGVAYKRLFDEQYATPISTPVMVSSSDMVAMNGSTDTLEIYVWVNGTNPTVSYVSGSISSSFAAHFVRNIN